MLLIHKSHLSHTAQKVSVEPSVNYSVHNGRDQRGRGRGGRQGRGRGVAHFSNQIYGGGRSSYTSLENPYQTPSIPKPTCQVCKQNWSYSPSVPISLRPFISASTIPGILIREQPITSPTIFKTLTSSANLTLVVMQDV